MAKIMIVDDAAIMRIQLKETLCSLGHEVIAEVSNGTEAVYSYRMNRPDLITMDITMPELDGVAAVKEIKRIDPDAKIIMCSAMGQQTLIVDAIQAGASDFILKPFNKERIEKAINKVLGA